MRKPRNDWWESAPQPEMTLGEFMRCVEVVLREEAEQEKRDAGEVQRDYLPG